MKKARPTFKHVYRNSGGGHIFKGTRVIPRVLPRSVRYVQPGQGAAVEQFRFHAENKFRIRVYCGDSAQM